ncbi:MAG TPA: EamA family transporter [Candidatus Thermoplasmatota archaeon]|nr:EamA family transporter [Candidatus Thermoplasmatota archaeon]
MQRRTLGIVAAFVAVYLIWGSTYLAIRFAVEDTPPFLMASARWLVAGAILFAWRKAAGDALPTGHEARAAALVGVALILGGNGLVSWAEQWVPSAFAALLIAVVPAWIALLVWARTKERPGARVASGIALGFLGVVALFAPALVEGLRGDMAVAVGIGAILVATVAWASGSLYSRSAPQPKSTLMGVAVQMLAGGAALAVAGLATGEATRVDLPAVSLRTWLSLGFLVFFGSIVAFSAYIWLLKQVPPSLVATYAFVNPVVAVALGALFAGERFTPLTLAASALIVVGVALVVTGGASRGPRREGPKDPVAEGDAS